MRYRIFILAALAALAAHAVQMASQPWVTNRIAEAVAAIPAPDFTTNNAALVETIQAKAPAPDLTPATNYTDFTVGIASNALSAAAKSYTDAAINAIPRPDLTPATNYTDLVVGNASRGATNYTDAATNAASEAAAQDTAARVEALSNAVYGVLGGLPDKSAVLSTNATGMVNKPVLGLFFARELDASPQNVKIYQPEMDYLAVNFLGYDTYMFTWAYGLYDSWQLDTYPQLVMRYMDVTNIVPPMITAATNALAQSMGGTPAEITVSGTVPYSKGLVNLTVSSGGTLSCNTNDWPNGAQVMVDAVLPATYTVASGISPTGYSAMPSDGHFLLVFTRLGTAFYVSTITSVE